jgi:uncharacterized membrane protein
VTLVSTAARGNTRRHLVSLLVALSVALNLCFIAGALWIRIHGPPPITMEDRLDRISAGLDLNSQQKEAFNRYSEAVRARLRQMHQAVDPIVGDAWSEVAKTNADETKVVQLFDEAGQTRRKYMREIAPLTLSFLATLSPDQRAKFVELIRQKPWEHPR